MKIKFILFYLFIFITFYLSVEKRTTLPSENVQSDESKSIEHDGGTNTEKSAEHTEENVEKNEEKSDDQEKEE